MITLNIKDTAQHLIPTAPIPLTVSLTSESVFWTLNVESHRSAVIIAATSLVGILDLNQVGRNFVSLKFTLMFLSFSTGISGQTGRPRSVWYTSCTTPLHCFIPQRSGCGTMVNLLTKDHWFDPAFLQSFRWVQDEEPSAYQVVSETVNPNAQS